ncbi:MAG TPA: SLBB domain-containing protein [Terracidiphilus sp.]|nr:SLBB domain-containing protein [Terracidiphilus sp.]
MRSRFFFAIAVSLFALAGQAQQYPSSNPYPDTYQQSPQVDCTDPANASLPQCTSSGSNLNPGSAPANPSATPQPLSSLPGNVPTYNEPTGRASNRYQPSTIPLRPEPLTEFQKFIASTTGEVLPIYGVSLFQNVPATFTPLENTPVPSDYVLGPDDELRVRIWGQVNFNANLRIDRSGDIFLPHVGEVHVGGLRVVDAQQQIHDAVARIYRNFQLLVEMGQTRSIQVYVTGEARRPGVYTVGALSTLIDALFASGGPSVQGSMRRIELRRGGQTVTTLDLYLLLVNGDKSKDAKLLSGDVIFIPPVGSEVAVAGSVRRPAVYEVLSGDSFGSILHDAGDITALASESRASLDRSSDHFGRETMEVKLDSAGLATSLRNGDVLRVFSQVSQYRKTVTLRGNLSDPGRFAWHEGMRLSDLIPDRESLLTRDYWWKRSQLGLPAFEFQSIPALSTLRQPTAPIDLRRLPTENPPIRTRQTISAVQPGVYVSSEDVYAVPRGPATYPALTYPPGQTNPYSPGQTYPGGQAYPPAQQQSEVDALVPSDQVSQSETQNQGGVGQQSNTPLQASQSALANEDQYLTRSLNPPPSPRTEVRLAVPDIDWSYAVIERIDPVTLKTKLITFDLGKLVNEHDPTQDLTLEPSDVVSIFSQSDIHVPLAEQTTFVRLEGEFIHAGTYSAHPGETLRELVARAGGLTPAAYLYGSVYTRESTRVLQQRRLDEFVRQMTLEMQRGTLALAVNPASNANDIASASAAQASEQAIVAQLRETRANGRIVLQFQPDSNGVAAIPDIPLENGDTFLIPSVPSTVNVLGAVFNQNSFVYHPSARVGATLNLAGGPNSTADKKRIFIIRASGSVVSRTIVHGMWNDEFFRLHLYPGDTIIVPEKIAKPSALRGVMDWTQVFSQLAFGAAAINAIQ